VRRELAASSAARATMPVRASGLAIRRVLEVGPELAVVDDIARGSFTEGGFAIDEELARPWSRIWVASTGARSSDGASTGTRSPDGASTGTRSPDGASTGTRSPDGASTGTRSPDGASLAGGEIVAFLIAWHVADELHVLNVATALHMRRRGVATAIMNEALAYARQSRVRIVLLEVRRSNRAAIRLYRTLGFSAMGLRPKYYSNDGEDAVEMVISLDPATGAIVPGRDEVRIES
jgi:ribosomal protein S18 acetylase RimI-like enzyme